MNALRDAAANAVAVGGKLMVSVRDAKNLPDIRGQGTGPVCILKCGKNIQRTECNLHHCVSPVWHETFTYAMKVANIPKVLFRLRVVTGFPGQVMPVQSLRATDDSVSPWFLRPNLSVFFAVVGCAV
jgi:hypothetical protein